MFREKTETEGQGEKERRREKGRGRANFDTVFWALSLLLFKKIKNT